MNYVYRIVLDLCFSCDSVEKLKSKCPVLEQEIRDSSRFKDFYQFTFNYAKNPGQKGLGKRMHWKFHFCVHYVHV